MPKERTYTNDDVERMKNLLLVEGLSVAEVANRVGYSQKVVVSAFKNHSGMTITEFRYSILPIEQFKELLAQGQSVHEVADTTGYNESQIRSAIMRTEGVSIAAFRERLGLAANKPSNHATHEKNAAKGALRRLRLPSSNRQVGRPTRTYEKTCLFCGEVFTSKNAQRRFCSRSCSVKSRPPQASKTVRPLLQKKCECCDRAFETKRPTQRYCGNKCRTARTSKDKTRLTDIPCDYCDRLFRPPQRIQRFCSRDCAYKGKRSSSHVHGKFKLGDGVYVRFESSFELVFLLFAFHHPDDYQSLRRCDFILEYSYNGKQYRYLPDFLCVARHGRIKLVEVKSTGTEAWQPEKTQAKLAVGRLWCKENDADFIYLTDEVESFVAMCDYVAKNHSLDVLQHVESGDALRKIVKRCVECGKRIPRPGTGIAAYLQRKFCSAACRNNSEHGKKQRLPSSQHVCPQCGMTFVGHRKKKFCSKDCYSESQRTLKGITCAVCGRGFQPNSSSQKTCGVECGAIFRAASRKGISLSEYREWRANNKPLPKRRCFKCGSSFVPHSSATTMCSACRQDAKTKWTLSLMTERLVEIRDNLGDRIPLYSEIYKSTELREKFNSCALAGAIYRFNQIHGIGSYRDFLRLHLGWEIAGKLNKSRTEEVFKAVVEKCGGVPRGLGKINDVFGHKGHAFEEAFKTHYGLSLTNYCKEHGTARIARQECGLK